MKSAIFFHLVNLITTISILLLMLSFLSPIYYSIWVSFTIFGLIGLQIEYVITQSAIRVTSLAFFKDGAAQYYEKALIAWKYLSRLAFIQTPIISIMGILYFLFGYLGNNNVSIHYILLNWLIFIFTYSLNFYFSINGLMLQAKGRVSDFNIINSISRITNLILVLLFLNLDLGLFSLSVSFFLSVLIGIYLMRRRILILDPEIKALKKHTLSQDTLLNIHSITIRFFIFTICNYLVFKSTYLIIIPFIDENLASSYSLSLQVCILASSFSLVLINQVLIPRISESLANKNFSMIRTYFLRCLIYQNTIFILLLASFFFIGSELLSFIKIDTNILDFKNFVLLGFTIFVEVNLIFFFSYLIYLNKFKILFIYVALSTLIFITSILGFFFYKNITVLLVICGMFSFLILLPALALYSVRSLIAEGVSFKV